MPNKPKLTPKQELFCKLYTTDREMFGNGTQAYIEAYNIDTNKKGSYEVARTGAYRLLSNDTVNTRINDLLESGGLNDEHVDKRLLFWINQGASPQTSLQAVREYNRLKERTKEPTARIDATINILTNPKVAERAKQLDEAVKDTLYGE